MAENFYLQDSQTNAVARLARIDRENLRRTILVVDEGIPAV